MKNINEIAVDFKFGSLLKDNIETAVKISRLLDFPVKINLNGVELSILPSSSLESVYIQYRSGF